MGRLPHGRARVSHRDPQAFAVCDRCGFLRNLPDLHCQYEFNARNLYNTHLKVCDRCLDEPSIQNLAPKIIKDPVPVIDPRPNPHKDFCIPGPIVYGIGYSNHDFGLVEDSVTEDDDMGTLGGDVCGTSDLGGVA
jgi:hypothetical protein